MTGVVPAVLAGLAVAIAGAALRPSAHRTRLAAREAGAGSTRHVTVGRAGDVLTRLRGRLTRQRPIGADAVAAWCDELSRRVRSGASLRESLAAVGSPDPTFDRELQRVRRGIERGQTAEAAVRRLDAHDPDLRLAVSVLAAAARLGGSPSAAIDRTAAALRQRSADRGDRLVQSAQARLSAHVLTVLPIVLLAVLAVPDADVRQVITEPIGAACVAAGLTCNLLGWWWMHRVIGR